MCDCGYDFESGEVDARRAINSKAQGSFWMGFVAGLFGSFFAIAWVRWSKEGPLTMRGAILGTFTSVVLYSFFRALDAAMSQ